TGGLRGMRIASSLIGRGIMRRIVVGRVVIGVLTGAIAVSAAGSGASAAGARGCSGVDYNAMVMEIVRALPAGGGYSLNSKLVQLPTITHHNIGGGRWEM